MVIFADRLEMDCDNGYNVKIYGLGLGAEFNAASGFAIECPSIEAEGTYYGLKAGASLMGGIDLGLFANKRGLCVLFGGSLGSLGASVSGARMIISRDSYR